MARELGSPGSGQQWRSRARAPVICFHREVEDGVGDGSIHPAANAAVCLVPSVGAWLKGRSPIDVAKETELAAHGLEGGAPLGVVGGSKLKLHGDVRLDSDGVVGLCHGDVVQISSGVGGVVAGDRGHQQIGSVEGGAQRRAGARWCGGWHVRVHTVRGGSCCTLGQQKEGGGGRPDLG